MKGIFIESVLFEKLRTDYLNEEQYQKIQHELLINPKSGDVIVGTGGLRKVRVAIKGRGKRGSARIIYYYLDERSRFYLLTIYAKNEMSDLSSDEKTLLKAIVENWKNEQT